jgi:Reverse transcriptase (RNA-dependent DNA polymerase)
MLGEVTLNMKVTGSSDTMEVDFVVVEELVVPALLGTPWINRYIWSIDPPQKSVLIHIDEAKEPFRSRLSSAPIRLSHPIRVSREQTLPPFSETWVNCNSSGQSLSLIKPSRRRDLMIQVKNGVKSLPHKRDTFSCLVANFSDNPRTFSSRQVIGEAESVSAWPEGKLQKQIRKEMCPGEEWETSIRESVPHLTEAQKDQLIATLNPHADMWEGKLGRISTVKHHILTSGPPVASQPYRAGPQSRTLIDAEINRILQMDVIETASGPWSAPVVLIPKPDGSIRFCIDYRKLNAVTKNDSYALPRVDDCLDSLGEARYFTTLDANCGYWQVDVNEDDREKTAFTCHQGLYQFKRMRFGLMTAPATFQRAIDVILSSVSFQCALTYLDDFVVYSPTFEKHLADLSTVLQLLQVAGVSLKRAKCAFAALHVK